MPRPSPEDLAAFEEHLKANAGKQINPAAEKAAKREMELGAKGGYAVYGDEPDRRKIAASYPEGELLKTDMSEAELHRAVGELSGARNVFSGYLNNETVPGFDTPRQTTLFDVEDRLEELPDDLAEALNVVSKYDFNGETSLFELPDDIENLVRKYRRIEQRLRDKTDE